MTTFPAILANNGIWVVLIWRGSFEIGSWVRVGGRALKELVSLMWGSPILGKKIFFISSVVGRFGLAIGSGGISSDMRRLRLRCFTFEINFLL